MHPVNLARPHAFFPAKPLLSLRLAVGLIVAMAMVTLSMVVGALPSDASGPTVVITDTLSPKSLSIRPGTTVTWVNRDSKDHRLHAEDGEVEFDSKNIEPGDRWSHTFATSGTASYHDHDAGHEGHEGHEGDHDGPYDGKVTVSMRAGGSSAGAPALAAAGSPAAPAPAAAAAPATAKVAIGGNFSPVSVRVSAGGLVTWTNTDVDAHTVTANDGSFDSGRIAPGASWSHRFAAAGTFAYVCLYHSDMRGTVSVPTSSGAVPAAKPAAAGAAGASGAHAMPAQPAGPSAASPAGAKAASHRVSISDSGFTPAVLNARVGDKVTWTNNGQDPHTVTGGPWDAPLNPGQSFTTVLRAVGNVAYVCTYHSGMKGTVRISAAPAGTKLPPPSAAPNGAAAQTTASAPAAVPAPGAQSHTVTISGNAYSPDPLVARVGDSVTWVNKDPMPHTVTGGPWDAMIMPGAKFTTVLLQPGTVKYVCTLHPGMGGSVQIKPALPGAKVPAAAPAAPAAHDKDMAKPAPVADAAAEKHLVTIKDFKYSPETLQAKVGDTVTFVNKDSAPHTATANDKSFDSGMLKQGGEFTVKLTKEGTFEYLCTYHPSMVGKIVVRAADAAAPATAEDEHAAPEMALTAGGLAGFGSGWVGLFLFLAGTQLRTRLRGRR